MDSSISLEKQLEHNADVYHLSIVRRVSFCNPFLSYVNCIKEYATEIDKLHRDGRNIEAGELFFRQLKRSDDVGRWQQFRDALQKEGYEFVHKLLLGEQVSEQDEEKLRIINLLQEKIAEDIVAAELWEPLRSRGMISDIDREKIIQISNNEGNTLASIHLILNMWKKKENWYEEFLNILIEIKREHVAERIDPDYVKKKMNQIFHARQENDMDTMESSEVQGHGEACCSQMNFAADTSLPVKSSSGVQGHGEACVSQINFPVDTSADISDDENISSQTSAKQVDAKLNMDIYESETNQQQNKLITNTSKIICSPTDDSSPPDSVSHARNEENVDNDDVAAKTLQLRPYQEELTTFTLTGKNAIIVAPTGSGKTIVAVKIMQDHLKKKGIGVRKILFLVNQVALAKQQYEACKEYMDAEWPLELISGETQNTNRVPLKYLLERNKILFMTAQIFLDALREKEINSITAVSLIVFDECHHTKLKHTFNQIMHLYMDLKLGSNAEHVTLPQIVGLTASVGVGKANKLQSAVDYIKNLCANLDGEIITVQNNVQNLAEYVKVTALDVKKCERRAVDKFHDFIAKKLMQPIEVIIQKRGVTNTQVVAMLQTKLEPTAQHGCDQYKQWISSLRNEVCKIEDQTMYRFVFTCLIFLDMYNDALILNEDCRTVDALNYLDKEFFEINESQKRVANETDQLLNENYEKNHNYLKCISTAPESKNPKIDCLESMLRSAFHTAPQSRAMVFVKTRAQAIALKNWMMETPGLKELKPGILTGTRAPASSGGTTKAGQNNVLQHFKQGGHKVILSTPVGEEGLDISACNLVIRYDHVTNEIAMVQARGRARAENSKFAVIGSAEKGTVQKEELNLMREMLMIQAIQKVQQDAKDSEQFYQELEKIQKTAKLLRENEALNYDGRTLNVGDFQLRCFKCKHFACISTEIKTIKNSQYVILSSDFDQRVNYTPHPKPETFMQDFKKQDKINCKSCGYNWGISVIYKNAKFPVAKIDCFLIVDSKGNCDHVKKWKNAPFVVEEISHGDMEKQLSLLSDSQ